MALKNRKTNQKSLSSHVEYSCSFCSDIYQTKSDRLEHMKQKHSERCCTYCDECYPDPAELEHHLRYAHADMLIYTVSGNCPLPNSILKNFFLAERVGL